MPPWQTWKTPPDRQAERSKICFNRPPPRFNRAPTRSPGQRINNPLPLEGTTTLSELKMKKNDANSRESLEKAGFREVTHPGGTRTIMPFEVSA